MIPTKINNDKKYPYIFKLAMHLQREEFRQTQ